MQIPMMKDPPYISVYVPSSSGAPGQSPVKSRSFRRWWNQLSRLQKSLILMFLLVLLIFSLFGGGLSSYSPVPIFIGGSSLHRYQGRKSPSEYTARNEIGDGFAALKSAEEEVIQGPKDHRPKTEEMSRNDPRGMGKVLSNYGDDADGLAQMELIRTIKPPMKTDRNFKELPKKSEISLQTSPRSLGLDDAGPEPQPNLREGLENKAEAIRHVISLDPVIPWRTNEKKTTKSKPKSPSPNVIESIPPKIDGNIFMKTEGKLKFEGPGNQRQKAVVDAFLHAWNGYRSQAWGKDHLRPVHGGGQDWFGLGLTLIDSLDTMYIMGLKREFYEARDWVEDSLSFDISKNVNLFETTIRVLGGLLSAFHLSEDSMFMKKAQELGEILLVGFKSPSGIPYSDVNLYKKTAHGPSWNPDSTTSEVTTIQLEFRDLGRITNRLVFEDAVMNVSRRVHLEEKIDGLVPIHISPQTGSFRLYSTVTLGARGDSYYEYLLKQWIQTGKTIDFFRDDYLQAGMRSRLLRKSPVNNLTYFGELDSGGKVFRPKMDHLVCYLPGTLALGYAHGLPSWHLDLAKELLFTCYQTYVNTPTGLAPEITFFNMDVESTSDFYVKPADAHNLLRPETVESLWYMWRLTGDVMYQDWGWEIFTSFLKYTKVQYGFSSINSVLNPNDVRPRDVMESFWMGETLKYFYLLFAPNDKPLFDLSAWVFNSEAHPLPVYNH